MAPIAGGRRATSSVAVTLLGVALLSGCPRDVPPSPPTSACVDFEPPLAAGTEYGSPAGHSPGDVVISSAGIDVAVFDFDFTTGSGTFNVATVEAAPAGFGSGQVLAVNNINLEFDFTTLPFTPSRVELKFRDLGGFENVAINSSSVFAGELSAAPSPVAGVTLAVTTSSTTGGVIGTAEFAGPVERIQIGGQEFWLDEVCAYQ